jgi:hypothetical protein
VAALIKSAIGSNAVLATGARGEFTVWVGDDRVAAKDANGFPIDEDVVSAVQRAIGKS